MQICIKKPKWLIKVKKKFFEEEKSNLNIGSGTRVAVCRSAKDEGASQGNCTTRQDISKYRKEFE